MPMLMREELLSWLAVSMGHKDIVQELIKEGAAVNIVDRHGDTAFKIAKRLRHREIMRILAKAEADAKARNQRETSVQSQL